MLNKELETYKDLYSEYIGYLSVLHNTHQVFVKKPSIRSFRKLRGCITRMRQIEKKMHHACKLAFREEMAITRPDKPITNQVKGSILKQKELNLKIVELLEREPYKRGTYMKIARELNIEERRVRTIHMRLQEYKDILLNDQQKQK